MAAEIFTSRGPALAHPPPSNLTLPQFMLDVDHPLKPKRGAETPMFIDDETGREYRFEEVKRRVNGLANGMARRFNLLEDDVVCIFSPNHIDYPIAVWATHRVGAVVSAANPAYTAEELQYQIEVSNARVVITHPNSLTTVITALRELLISIDRIVLTAPLPPWTGEGPKWDLIPFPTIDDLIKEGFAHPQRYIEPKLKEGEGMKKLAFLSFSSGTTGKPKAVEIPHYSVISNVVQVATFNRVNDPNVPANERRFQPGDVSIGVLPMFHIYGLVVNLHCTIFFGHALIVIPKFNFVDMLNSIVRYNITHLWIVPPQMVLFCKHPAAKEIDALSRIKFVMAGAAPISPELQKQFVSLLNPNAAVGQGYGMTETATMLTMQPFDQKGGGVPGSAGQLISGTEARVIKPDGTYAKVGEQGELVVRGPQNALRYSNNEEATRETFQDGWVRTGDEVVFNEKGDMFIVDRKKEILKVRGFQVAPAELEGHLLDHPDVADAGVVGIPDEYSGELPVGFVVLHAEAAKKVKASKEEAVRVKLAIQKHVSDAKVKYKWLDGGVEFVDAIPKNPSGKILRRVLRDHAKTLPRASTPAPKL